MTKTTRKNTKTRQKTFLENLFQKISQPTAYRLRFEFGFESNLIITVFGTELGNVGIDQDQKLQRSENGIYIGSEIEPGMNVTWD